MFKKFGVSILSAFLAIAILALSPLQVMAESNTEYLKEICIGYGEEGLQKLKDADYTVWEEKDGKYLDANEGGTGSAVYIGYKTTNKKEEAITDIAVMPMGSEGDRSYSFDAYADEMKALNKQINAMLDQFDAAIEEFRANYKKTAPYNDYALRAYQVLNMYIDDDTGLGLGELFTRDVLDSTDIKENGASTGTKLKEIYHNVLMMGNATAVSAIKTALAIGCTETEGTTFLDRLKEAEYTETIDETKNDSIQTVANVIETFQDELRAAKSVYDTATAYNGGIEAYLKDVIELGEGYSDVIAQITLIDVMMNTPYGDATDLNDNSLSFFDIMMLPTTISPANKLVMNTNLLFVLVNCMTPGQISMTKYMGLAPLIRNAYSTTLEKEKGTDGVEHFALGYSDYYFEQLSQYDPISVYLGVDRTVFNDYTSVAITDAAIRSQALNNELGVVSDFDTSTSYNAAKIGMAVAGGLTFAAGLAMTVKAAAKWGKEIIETHAIIGEATAVFEYSYKTYDQTAGKLVRHVLRSYDKTDLNNQVVNLMRDPSIGVIREGKYVDTYEFDISYKDVLGTSLGTKVTAVAGALFMAAGIALAIVGFLQSTKTPEVQKVTYTRIPRAIIDVKRRSNGDDLYFVYYASKTVNTTKAFDEYCSKISEDAAASLKLYGDLNGLNTYEQWTGLYYAKDLRLGSPLTTKILVKNTASLSTLQKEKYTPAHDFFNNSLTANNQNYTPFDLNKTSQKAGHPSIYVFFKRDTKVQPLTSTIVAQTASFNWFALVTFCVGAGLAAGTTGLVLKRKYKKSKAPECSPS